MPNWPGLSREVRDICKEINLPDINDMDISEGEIKQAVFDHHYGELVANISNSKKMMRQKEETSYRCQDYLIQIQEQKEKNIVNQKCSNITNENCSIKSDNYSDVQVVDEICRRQMVEWCYR